MKTNVARLLLAAGVLFATAMVTAGVAAADCPAPSISINPSSGRGGDTFHIDGRNFFQSCSDAGNVGDTNIQFRFLQGGNVYDLGSATAGTPNGDFSGTLFVPTNTVAGSATVKAFGANGSPAVPFTVTQSTIAGGGATPATTPRATATTVGPTATTAAAAPTTTVVPAAPTATTSSTTTTEATTATTAAPVSKQGGGLKGGGLALVIILLALVVIGTILAALATAGRLPMPRGRPRPRVERARAAEAEAAAATATAAVPVAASTAFDEPVEPDRYESSTAPIEPIPDPFAPEPNEPTAPVESAALDAEEPSGPVESSAFDDEEPSAPVESSADDRFDDEPEEPDRYESTMAPIEPNPDPYAPDLDEPSAPIEPAGDEIAFPDDEEHRS